MKLQMINTYESLGRFIIEQLYDILLHKTHCSDYRYLKYEIQQILTIHPFVDQSFAMNKYNHGDTKYYFCKYRWENVMDYYVDQQCQALFLQHIRNPGASIDSICIMAPYNRKLLNVKDLGSMVDRARQITKHNDEYLLQKKHYQDLINLGIQANRNRQILNWQKHEEYIRSKQ